MSKKSSAILILVVALIFSAYVSLAQACDELTNDGHCKCYLTVKVPKHKLTLGKEQNANDPILFVKNETAKPVAIVFTKGSEVVREICVKPCAEETVIMEAGKLKYEISGCPEKGLVKGVQNFAKGNNYNWVIDAKFAGYNTITKQIGECAPVCEPKCEPVCPPAPVCKPVKVCPAPVECKPEVVVKPRHHKHHVCTPMCPAECKPACAPVECKPVEVKPCVPVVDCVPVIKVKPIAAPVVSAPVEVKPVACAPVCEPVCKPVCVPAPVCKPACGAHKHMGKCCPMHCQKMNDCADRTGKFFNHKPCLMNLAPVKPVEVPKVEEKPAEVKPVEVKVENAYIEMINASCECVTYLVSGPGVAKKVDLKPCQTIALEVLPGKYAVVASVKGVMSPMQSLVLAAGQKVEVKY